VVAKEKVVFQDFPGNSLHLHTFSLPYSDMHVKIKKAPRSCIKKEVKQFKNKNYDTECTNIDFHPLQDLQQA
jgi:hypothetical protein